jgi:hypothetical protein
LDQHTPAHTLARLHSTAWQHLTSLTLTQHAFLLLCTAGVAGIPVEVVGKERRQDIMNRIREQHPRLIVVDYTTPNCVNGEQTLWQARYFHASLGTAACDLLLNCTVQMTASCCVMHLASQQLVTGLTPQLHCRHLILHHC